MGVFMNFRKLITYLTMGTAAAMPLAVAQNPTILQGNYISNVFGQSNFILNPNAQTNVANVTVSSATVTRSTTTPLVATTEFNITTSTATGYADWATRTFDQGMKNQNCEARFTYRGFSVGSTTVQIRQGSNTVAQLTLTASTDPRIASINFPCGDLSSATTLRVQQATASLTGTNELSGLYLGLATNQANVAQAEFYGSMFHYGNGNCIWSGNNASPIAADADCTTYSKQGANLQPSTNVPAIQFTPVKSGSYEISVSLSTGSGAGDNISCSVYQNGVDAIPLAQAYFAGGTARELRQASTVSVSLTSGTAYTFDIRCSGGDTILARALNESISWTVHRFPTSSELVVTPERQNVYGGVKWSGNIDISTISSVTNAIINTTNFGTPTPFGKASIASSSCGLSANDVGVCFDNVPPGTYEITTSFEQGSVYSFGTPGATACSARIHVSGTSFSDTAVASAFTEVGASGQTDWVTLSSGVVTISSFQPKLSLVLKQSKSGNNGRCLIRSSANGTTYPAIPTITMKPLDQPSNSALYVQGPVLGAQTGAAIPTSYVGEQIKANVTSFTNFPTSSTYGDCTSITLTAGVWDISALAVTTGGSGVTSFLFGIGTASGTGSSGLTFGDNLIAIPVPSTGDSSGSLPQYRVAISSTTTYYAKVRSTYSTVPQYTCRISGTRIN